MAPACAERGEKAPSAVECSPRRPFRRSSEASGHAPDFARPTWHSGQRSARTSSVGSRRAAALLTSWKTQRWAEAWRGAPREPPRYDATALPVSDEAILGRRVRLRDLRAGIRDAGSRRLGMQTRALGSMTRAACSPNSTPPSRAATGRQVTTIPAAQLPLTAGQAAAEVTSWPLQRQPVRARGMRRRP
jgi:hypothetical protein